MSPSGPGHTVKGGKTLVELRNSKKFPIAAVDVSNFMRRRHPNVLKPWQVRGSDGHMVITLNETEVGQ